MKANWHRVSTTLFDREQKIGTISIYFDYDLRCWLFGVSMDPDPCWHDFRVSVGPIGLSFTYWRRPVFRLDANC